MKIEIDTIEKTFNRIVNDETINSLEDVMVFKESSNTFSLYNKYFITKQDNEVIAYNKNTDLRHRFINLKNAVAWCILDKRHKFYESDRILFLDRMLLSAESDIKRHKKMFLKAKENEQKFIFLAKLNEDKVKKEQIKKELRGYIEETMTWQRKKFALNTTHN